MAVCYNTKCDDMYCEVEQQINIRNWLCEWWGVKLCLLLYIGPKSPITQQIP